MEYCLSVLAWQSVHILPRLSSDDQLRCVLSEYLAYYHRERIHQGLNKIIEPHYEGNHGEIICIERLGGLLKSYYRKAA